MSARLVRYLRSGPIAFRVPGPGARPEITARTAERAAVRKAQWDPATANGATLVRLTRSSGRMYAGVLAWLVALRPGHPVHDGSRSSSGPAANYVVAFISATDGKFIGDAAGYNPALAGHAGGSGWAMGELSGRVRFVT